MTKLEEKFRDFLGDYSRTLRGSIIWDVKFLLYDYISIAMLSKGTNVMFFCNELERLGHLSYESPIDVLILSEIAVLLGTKSATNVISKYLKSRPKSKVLEIDDGTRISEFRRRLFLAVQQIEEDDVKDLKAAYNLNCEVFFNRWDLIFHLEKEKLLVDTTTSIERFAKNINKVAHDTCLGITEKSGKSGLTKTSGKSGLTKKSGKSARKGLRSSDKKERKNDEDDGNEQRKDSEDEENDSKQEETEEDEG